MKPYSVYWYATAWQVTTVHYLALMHDYTL